MTKERKKRKWVWVFLALILVPIILLAALPLWLPWVLGAMSGTLDIRYGSYERLGYTQFALLDLQYDANGTSLSAKRAVAYQPLAWVYLAWRHSPGDAAPSPYLLAADWSVRITPQEEPPASEPAEPSTGPQSVPAAWKRAEILLDTLQEWAPSAYLTNGTVHFSGQILQVESIRWTGYTLEVQARSEEYQQNAATTLALPNGKLPYLTLEVQPLDLSSRISLTAADAGRVALDGAITWKTNRLDLNAEFLDDGWLPELARVEGPDLRLPPDLLGLDGYDRVLADLLLQWRKAEYQARLKAEAQPLPDVREAIPVDIDIAVEGTLEDVTVESLLAQTPWLRLELSNPVTLQFDGQLPGEGTRLQVALDLDDQPWAKLHGTLSGEIALEPGEEELPIVNLHISGTNLLGHGLQVEQFLVDGKIEWPIIQLEQLEGRFEDGSVLHAHGTLDWLARSLETGEVAAELHSGMGLLPHTLKFEHLRFTAAASGPVTNLTHRGELTLQRFQTWPLVPIQLRSDWQGRSAETNHLKVQVEGADHDLQLILGADLENVFSRPALRLQTLDWNQHGTNTLTLAEPAVLQWIGTNAMAESNGWQAVLSPFRWHGEDASLEAAGSLSWPQAGSIGLAVRQFAPQLFSSLVLDELPKVLVESANLSADWTNGPIHLNFDATAQSNVRTNLPLRLHLDASSSGTQLQLRNLLVASGDESILQGRGILPLVLDPTSSDGLALFSTNAPLQLDLRSRPHETFWKSLAEWTRVHVKDPQILVQLDGSARAPEGLALVEVAEVRYQSGQTNQAAPPMTDLLIRAALKDSVLSLEQLAFRLEGQQVLANGRLPLGDSFPLDWKPAALAWTNGTGQVAIPDAELAPFARLAPEKLAPQGTVLLQAQLLEGGKLAGFLTVSNAATRPLQPLGPIQDIHAHLKFQDRLLTIQEVRGTLGGEPVVVEGNIHLSQEALETGFPFVDLRVRGRRVPLVRQPDLILRSDLDIVILKTNAAPGKVGGAIELQESLFLADLDSLIPGGVASPSRRPPYFSVTNQPFNDWTLDLRVRGDRFMRIKTPLFRGAVSVNLKLEGDLEEPMALGEATINQGSVRFPFANLQVKQGFVSFTSENPYDPRLFVNAGTRLYGYDVTVNVTGPASQPVVEFSSVPSLGQEDIILMLTAGQIPRDDLRYSNEQKASKLGMFIGKNLISQFTGDTSSEERLTIRSGENVTSTGKETLHVEYKLTDDWSVVAEYDRFNELNAGVKWKVFSR